MKNIRVKDILLDNDEEKEIIFIYLMQGKVDENGMVKKLIWEGWMCDIPKEFLNSKVIGISKSLMAEEKGIDAFYLAIAEKKKGYSAEQEVLELRTKLQAYESTGLTPGQIFEMDKMYKELCVEMAECRKQYISEKLAEIGE